MTTLFISDLHLCDERPRTTALFKQFISTTARNAEALYILGDLFEFWIGDDQLDHDPLAQIVAQSLASLTLYGTQVFFMHGNRDFLIGNRFADSAGLTLLADPTHLIVDDRSLLLMHGDTLCTDDTGYQVFRRQVREPAWQASILAKPYDERVALAHALRSRSDVEKSMKADSIMDVNQASVAAVLKSSNYPCLIHGHTHRPAHHRHMIDGRLCDRWVLADWHDTGASLVCSAGRLVPQDIVAMP